MPTAVASVSKRAVAASLERSPIIGVVRHGNPAEAARQAREFAAGGLELVEITFTVPDAVALVGDLLAARGEGGPPWIGMGTVTTSARAHAAIAAGAEFIVTPNLDPEVAALARGAGLYLVLGALTPT